MLSIFPRLLCMLSYLTHTILRDFIYQEMIEERIVEKRRKLNVNSFSVTEELEGVNLSSFIFSLTFNTNGSDWIPWYGWHNVKGEAKARIRCLLKSFFAAIKKSSNMIRKGDKMGKGQAKLLIWVMILREYCNNNIIEFKALGPQEYS